MTELRQRMPRIKDNKHLDYIRSLPCCICGDNTTTEAAHIRTGNLLYGKPNTGMQEKPSDVWSLPLCNKHHREQHTMVELSFWAKYDINPFELAIFMRAR